MVWIFTCWKLFKCKLWSYYFVETRNITMVGFMMRKCGRAFIHSFFFQILREKESHKFGLRLQGLPLDFAAWRLRKWLTNFDPIRVKFSTLSERKNRTDYISCCLGTLVLTYNCPISGLCSALQVDKWSKYSKLKFNFEILTG